MSPWKVISSLFTSRDRVKLGVLVLLLVISGLLEILGIGLLYPYAVILQDPSKVTASRYLGPAYQSVAFLSDRSFALVLSVILLAIFCIKAMLTLWLSDFQVRFIYSKHSQLAHDLLAQYLNRPYAFFLSANTATLIGNLTTSLNQVFGHVIQAALSLLAECIVLVGLLAILTFLSPVVTLVGMFFVGGLSLLFIKVAKSRFNLYAKEGDIRWKSMIRTVNEAISSVKELQVLGRTQFFVDKFERESERFVWAFGRNTVLSQLPKVTLETGAVAALVLVAVLAVLFEESTKELFALLAVFALATIRIVPSANRMLRAWNDIAFNRPAIDTIGELVSTLPAWNRIQARSSLTHAGGLRLRRNMSISIKAFSYPNSGSFSIRNINLNIGKGQTVAFIGQSGSGKTTLIDLMLGLFPEFDGQILVDGHDIRQDVGAWRKSIGYISQNLYMTDDTIAHNVAFGVCDEDIETERLGVAISLAGLDLVVQSQPAGLDTLIGDRGIRLSGGERQRIAIARALYHDPDLLILDEATSALDNATERQIVDSILALSPAKTVIMIAHRLSTVKRCDMVYLMQDGTIIDRGSFDEVSRRHPGLVDGLNDVALAAE
jgi:ATP-binding cassette subfamily C protein